MAAESLWRVTWLILRMAMQRNSTAEELWRSSMAESPCWHAQETHRSWVVWTCLKHLCDSSLSRLLWYNHSQFMNRLEEKKHLMYEFKWRRMMLYDGTWCCMMSYNVVWCRMMLYGYYVYDWLYICDSVFDWFWRQSWRCISGLRIHRPGVLQIPWLHLAF